MAINVLIVDDHRIMREGLRHLLERSDGIRVVGEADNGVTAVQLAQELQPDLIIMDITMPEMGGIEATRRIIANSRNVKVLALSMHSDKRFVMEALDAGAKGYLLKDCASEELLVAVQKIYAGEGYLCSKVAGVVLNNLQGQQQEENAQLELLTKRETEIFKLLANGMNTKEIAFSQNVSTKTIETQRLAVMKKLQLRNLSELTKLAIREGVVSVG